MSKVVLQCKNLTKRMGKKNIVSNISFDLYEKDILGFIGPNGAGKTTIIKLILGLYKIDIGDVIIANSNLNSSFVEAISNVGAIIENPDMYMYMTGLENLTVAAKIYGIPKKRVFDVVKLVGLEDSIYEKVSKYSLGMRQRLGIAQAIIHDPKILILDEPVNGLDPQGIIDLNKLLKELSSSGMSIIISSHILSELESLCNKFCFVKDGRIVDYRIIDNIDRENNYIFEVSSINLNHILTNYKLVDDSHIMVNIKKEKISKIIKKLIKNKIEIYEMRKEKSSLEKIYLSIMESDSNA